MNINKNRVFKFYIDAGHGWLAVPIAYLKDVCTSTQMAKISQYSYIRGNTVYLEEDCDASIFINAWKWTYNDFHYENKYCNKDRSPIRSYDSFTEQKLIEKMFPPIDTAS